MWLIGPYNHRVKVFFNLCYNCTTTLEYLRTGLVYYSTFNPPLGLLCVHACDTQIHTHIHTLTCAHTCTQTQALCDMPIHTHIHLHAHTHMHTLTCTNTCMYTHTHTYAYTHVYKHMHVHTHTHTHTHTHRCTHRHAPTRDGFKAFGERQFRALTLTQTLTLTLGLGMRLFDQLHTKNDFTVHFNSSKLVNKLVTLEVFLIQFFLGASVPVLQINHHVNIYLLIIIMPNLPIVHYPLWLSIGL